ncbi:MAG: hypothetical protein WCB94_07385 [Terriglobales bacterium]
MQQAIAGHSGPRLLFNPPNQLFFRRDGHGIGPDVEIIFVVDVDPLLGALGSAGAIATIGPGEFGCSQSNKRGCVVRLYRRGGGAKDQLTGSGLTVVGEAEKVPVAAN